MEYLNRRGVQNLDNTLAEKAGMGERVLFYPSSGYSLGRLLSLDCSLFVLAEATYGLQSSVPAERSQVLRRLNEASEGWRLEPIDALSQHGGPMPTLAMQVLPTRPELVTPPAEEGVAKERLCVLFGADNRRVLGLLARLGIELGWFVGICDGCQEGGNWECVNDMPFLEAVFRMVSPQGMLYYTDHSDLLWPRHHEPTWLRPRRAVMLAPYSELMLPVPESAIHPSRPV